LAADDWWIAARACRDLTDRLMVTDPSKAEVARREGERLLHRIDDHGYSQTPWTIVLERFASWG
jgi:hypothetical protein